MYKDLQTGAENTSQQSANVTMGWCHRTSPDYKIDSLILTSFLYNTLTDRKNIWLEVANKQIQRLCCHLYVFF